MTTNPTHPPANPSQTRRFIHVGSGEVEIARLAPAPTARRSTAADETAYIGALTDAASNGLLPARPPEGLGRSLARTALDDPIRATTRIRHGIVTAHTDTADVAVHRTTLSPLTALPGEQPRGAAAGGRPAQVHEPGAGFDATASRLGLRVLLFDDRTHLRDWCADSLSRSLIRAVKRGRPAEIAATGVRRPVSASMVLLQFVDGTGQQWVPMLSDGISRFAVCAAGLLGELHSDPATAAHVIADHLVPTGLTSASPAHELARRMRRNYDTVVVNRYRAHLHEDGSEGDDPGTGGADEEAVTMRQFFTLPADVHLLATDPATGHPYPMEPVMEAVVHDFHTGQEGWGSEDDSRYTAVRALKRMTTAGDIGADLFDLAANRTNPDTAACLQPTAADPTGFDTATDERSRAAQRDRQLLRRAVTLMATLLGPSMYPTMKAALKFTSGRQRLTIQQMVEYVAPLVCEPWGTAKPSTRAWAYGGPVPAWIRDVELVPVHPADYLDLVGVALDPRASTDAVTAAQLELALAGGTALIADGLLTTALVGGSGSAPTSLPFRGTISAAVEALTRTEEGLTSLAVAANAFRPSRSARSARLPAIDLERPDRVARDGVGQPIRTTEVVLAGYAAQAGADRSEETPPPASPEPTPVETMRARARHLPTDTRGLLRGVELTKALHDECGEPTGLTEDDLDAVLESLSRALRLVGRLT